MDFFCIEFSSTDVLKFFLAVRSWSGVAGPPAGGTKDVAMKACENRGFFVQRSDA
jgi:hypothetical protein